MFKIPDDMDVPAMRRIISRLENVRWLVRNLPIKNREHPQFEETMAVLQGILFKSTI
jgi:hypothetical protein